MSFRTSDMPTSPPPRRIRRQRLAVRLGLAPYYTISEHSATRLVLHSRPDANTSVGRVYTGCATALALLNPIIIFAAFFTGSQTMGALVVGMLLAWPFALLGWLGFRIGRAIATTSNTITADADTRTIVYTQTNHINRPRSQTLQWEQVARLRLRERWFKPPGLFRRRHKIVALEMVTDEGFTWFVDSAAEASALMPTATALGVVLGLGVEGENKTTNAPTLGKIV